MLIFCQNFLSIRQKDIFLTIYSAHRGRVCPAQGPKVAGRCLCRRHPGTVGAGLGQLCQRVRHRKGHLPQQRQGVLPCSQQVQRRRQGRHRVGRIAQCSIHGKAALIQSVGSKELLDEIEKVAARMELVQDVLLEVNIGGEEAKSGFAPEELPQAAAYAKGLAHIRVRGLMTIPPVAVEKGKNIPYFEKVHRLFVDISREMYDNKWEYISMGMSGDYADAVRCGANMVRVGSAIFGARNYQK